jgi:pSer/pThr/pTyr-binding forkhead associated (FHA) protein
MSMKLVFPGGEHPQVLLEPGVSRVGSDPQATIVLHASGVLPQHCQLHVSATGVMLDVPHGIAVSVNGRPVEGVIALRAGDSVGFDHVLARLAPTQAEGAPDGRAFAANDDVGLTVMRPVMPMFVLRGVTGGAFGRSYPLHGPLTVGRSPECDVQLGDPGLSRVHARLVPCDDGVQIEDLDSTNGTFVNDHRVKRAKAGIGDEIGFDKVRFRLIGSAASHLPAPETDTPPALPGGDRGTSRAVWPTVAVLVTLVTVATLILLVARAL